MGKNGTVVENWRHYYWSDVLEKEKELGCELYKQRLAFCWPRDIFLCVCVTIGRDQQRWAIGTDRLVVLP